MGLLEDVVLDKLTELLAIRSKDFVSMHMEVCIREVPGVLINSVEFASINFQKEVKYRDLYMLPKLSAKLQEHLINKSFVVLDIRQIVV